MHFDQIRKKNDFTLAHSLHKRQETLCYATFVESTSRAHAIIVRHACFYQLWFAPSSFSPCRLRIHSDQQGCSRAAPTTSVAFSPLYLLFPLLRTNQDRWHQGFSPSSAPFKYYPLETCSSPPIAHDLPLLNRISSLGSYP